MSEEGSAVFGADGWWDAGGVHALLHVINPVRINYIRARTGSIAGKRVADIGCGGGILAEKLVLDGAQVTAIDPQPEVIETARNHANASSIPIDYRVCTSAELAAQEPRSFDLVVCMEMLEHVDAPGAEISEMAKLLRPNGSLIIATINRTPLAYVQCIIVLERCLAALPRNSHSYKQFRTPEEVCAWCKDTGLQIMDVCGANWSFFGKTFLLSRTSMPVNYLVHATTTA